MTYLSRRYREAALIIKGGGGNPNHDPKNGQFTNGSGAKTYNDGTGDAGGIWGNSTFSIQREATPNKQKEFGRLTKHIAKLTNDNFHTEALIHAAKYFGLTDHVTGLKANLVQHLRAGSLTGVLQKDREARAAEIMTHAKSKLSPEDYSKFHEAF